MEGRLVRLRAYERSDLEAVMKWINDEDVTTFLGGPTFRLPVSSVAEARYVEGNTDPASPNKVLVIETLANPRYIGATDLHAIDWYNRHAEVGIVIGDKSCWGKGYGSDAMGLMLRLAFERLNLNRVSLRVFDFNARAIRSYEKCGFVREGVLRQDRFWSGHYCDTIVMGILASEYRKLSDRAATERRGPKAARTAGSSAHRRKS